MNAVATEAEITLPRDGAAAQPPRVARSLMRVAVDARGAALAVIAIVAAVFALHWARTFCVSLLLGILLAYTLNPLVVRMQQIRIPRAIAAALAVLALVAVCVLAIEALGGQVNAIAQELPDAATKISARIAKLRNGQPGTIANVQAAAQEIEKATNQVAATPASGRPATRLVVEQPGFNLGSFLLANSIGVAAFAGQAVMVVFLVFFLLSSGDAFKRKLVRIAGPSLSRRKITVQVLDDINASIQQFMLMLLATNVLLAILTWLALRAVGLDNAGAWSLAAGLLHVIPYVGPVVLAAAVGTAAFLQFETFTMALAAAGTTLAISAFIGFIVATWMTGKFAKMNSAAVFVALLFWGWLWGMWGLLLAIPIVVTIKVASEMVEPLQPLAELLGQ